MSQSNGYSVKLYAPRFKRQRLKPFDWAKLGSGLVASTAVGIGLWVGANTFFSWFQTVLSFVLSTELSSSVGLTILKSVAALSFGVAAARLSFPLLAIATDPILERLRNRTRTRNDARLQRSLHKNKVDRVANLLQESGLDSFSIEDGLGLANNESKVSIEVIHAGSLPELAEKLKGVVVYNSVGGIPVEISFAGDQLTEEFTSLAHAARFLNPTFEMKRHGLDKNFSLTELDPRIEVDNPKLDVLRQFAATMLAKNLVAHAQEERLDPAQNPIRAKGVKFESLLDLIKSLDERVGHKAEQKIRLGKLVGLDSPGVASRSEVKAALWAVRRITPDGTVPFEISPELANVANQAAFDARRSAEPSR